MFCLFNMSFLDGGGKYPLALFPYISFTFNFFGKSHQLHWGEVFMQIKECHRLLIQ